VAIKLIDLVDLAASRGQSLNAFIKEAIEEHVERIIEY
jgi:predicted HicB family RNase H-like nuclease